MGKPEPTPAHEVFNTKQLSFNVDDLTEPLMQLSEDGEHLVVAYLTQDLECTDPTEFDGEGRVLHLNDPKERKEVFSAMGRDQYGDPELGLVEGDTEGILTAYRELLRQKDDAYASFLADTQKADTQETVEFLKKYSGKVGVEHEDVLQHLWENLLRTGKIGEPLAIMLDIYEHGGRSYSIAGTGMQCRFDTARGGAFWVPDECARENIVHQANVQLLPSGVKFEPITIGDTPLVNVSLPLSSGASYQFTKETYAAAAIHAVEQHYGLQPASLEQIRSVATEYAKGVLGEYNAWVNGETFGVIIEKFERCRSHSGLESWAPEKSYRSDAWGYIGRNHAVEDMREGFQHAVNELNQAMAPAAA